MLQILAKEIRQYDFDKDSRPRKWGKAVGREMALRGLEGRRRAVRGKKRKTRREGRCGRGWNVPKKNIIKTDSVEEVGKITQNTIRLEVYRFSSFQKSNFKFSTQ